MRLLLIVALLTVPSSLVGCASNHQLRDVEAARAQLRSERALAEKRSKEFDKQRRATMEELDHKLNLIRVAQRNFEKMVTAKSIEINALTKRAEQQSAKSVTDATRVIDAMIQQRLDTLRIELLQLKSKAAQFNGAGAESLKKLLENLERRDRQAKRDK